MGPVGLHEFFRGQERYTVHGSEKNGLYRFDTIQYRSVRYLSERMSWNPHRSKGIVVTGTVCSTGTGIKRWMEGVGTNGIPRRDDRYDGETKIPRRDDDTKVHENPSVGSRYESGRKSLGGTTVRR